MKHFINLGLFGQNRIRNLCLSFEVGVVFQSVFSAGRQRKNVEKLIHICHKFCFLLKKRFSTLLFAITIDWTETFQKRKNILFCCYFIYWVNVANFQILINSFATTPAADCCRKFPSFRTRSITSLLVGSFSEGNFSLWKKCPLCKILVSLIEVLLVTILSKK